MTGNGRIVENNCSKQQFDLYVRRLLANQELSLKSHKPATDSVLQDRYTFACEFERISIVYELNSRTLVITAADHLLRLLKIELDSLSFSRGTDEGVNSQLSAQTVKESRDKQNGSLMNTQPNKQSSQAGNQAGKQPDKQNKNLTNNQSNMQGNQAINQAGKQPSGQPISQNEPAKKQPKNSRSEKVLPPPTSLKNETAESLGDQLAKQPANQSANQPVKQPANQPANQPTKQPANQPANQPTKQPANQSANQKIKQTAKQPTKSAKLSAKKPTKEQVKEQARELAAKKLAEEKVKAEAAKLLAEEEATRLEELYKNGFSIKKYPSERLEDVLKKLKALKGVTLRQLPNADGSRSYRISDDKNKVYLRFIESKKTLQLQGKRSKLFGEVQVLASQDSDYLTAVSSHIDLTGEEKRARDMEKRLKKLLPNAFDFLSEQSRIDLTIGMMDIGNDEVRLSDYSMLLVPPYRGLERLIFDLQRLNNIEVKMIGQAYEKTDAGEYVLKLGYRRKINSVVYAEVMSALYTEYFARRNFYAHSDITGDLLSRVITEKAAVREIFDRLIEVVEYNIRKLKEIGLKPQSQGSSNQ